ncbi:hypothetical protein ACJQWK_10982 [Exserohilum turcicum]
MTPALSSDLSSKSLVESTQSVDSTLEEPQTVSPSPSSTSSSSLSWSSWKSKLHMHHSTTPPVPGKEPWRDATLSDKERWKEWQKAKDREQMRGSATGFFTEFYKGRGKTGYWLDVQF